MWAYSHIYAVIVKRVGVIGRTRSVSGVARSAWLLPVRVADLKPCARSGASTPRGNGASHRPHAPAADASPAAGARPSGCIHFDGALGVPSAAGAPFAPTKRAVAHARLDGSSFRHGAPPSPRRDASAGASRRLAGRQAACSAPAAGMRSAGGGCAASASRHRTRASPCRRHPRPPRTRAEYRPGLGASDAGAAFAARRGGHPRRGRCARRGRRHREPALRKRVAEAGPAPPTGERPAAG